MAAQLPHEEFPIMLSFFTLVSVHTWNFSHEASSLNLFQQAHICRLLASTHLFYKNRNAAKKKNCFKFKNCAPTIEISDQQAND